MGGRLGSLGPVINCQESLGRLNKAILVTSWFISDGCGGGGGGGEVKDLYYIAQNHSVDFFYHLELTKS